MKIDITPGTIEGAMLLGAKFDKIDMLRRINISIKHTADKLWDGQKFRII